jgi:hypothetical protein
MTATTPRRRSEAAAAAVTATEPATQITRDHVSPFCVHVRVATHLAPSFAGPSAASRPLHPPQLHCSSLCWSCSILMFCLCFALHTQPYDRCWLVHSLSGGDNETRQVLIKCHARTPQSHCNCCATPCPWPSIDCGVMDAPSPAPTFGHGVVRNIRRQTIASLAKSVGLLPHNLGVRFELN